MNKFIIDNRTDLSDMDAIRAVQKVIAMGRISNNGKQYCHVSVVRLNNKEYNVYSLLNKKSDRFVITPCDE